MAFDSGVGNNETISPRPLCNGDGAARRRGWQRGAGGGEVGVGEVRQTGVKAGSQQRRTMAGSV